MNTTKNQQTAAPVIAELKAKLKQLEEAKSQRVEETAATPASRSNGEAQASSSQKVTTRDSFMAELHQRIQEKFGNANSERPKPKILSPEEASVRRAQAASASKSIAEELLRAEKTRLADKATHDAKLSSVVAQLDGVLPEKSAKLRDDWNLYV